MKKITAIFALLLAFVMIFSACQPNSTTAPVGTTVGGTTEGSTSGTTATTATTGTTTPDPEKKTIKILSIGNSFSDDATQWLGYILMEMGYDIYLGNLYIGGCSIDTHWANAQSGEKAYDYRTCQWGSWKSTKQSLEYGIKAQEWDIITVQQVSQNSGMPETFGNLQNLLDFINSKKKNSDAKVFWHMTWAYEGDSTHSGFPNYNSDQMTMYNAIVNAAKEKILTNNAFTGVIPSGTAIQNLRTSYLGDHLTRDGYHLSYDVGRYTAALTWAKLLTGESIDAVTYTPKEYPNVAKHLPAIKEAVNNAVAKPLEITPAKITTYESMTMTQADKDFLTAQGKNPADYHLIDLDLMLNSFYNSSSNANRNSKATNYKGDILKYYYSTDMYNKNDLPNGTIIRIDAGYQYRPEGWTATNVKTDPRPDNVTQNVVVVDNAWWGDFKYRAFNIAYVGGATEVKESDYKAFQIYVPNAPAAEPEKPGENPGGKPVTEAETTDEAMTLAGYDLTKYTKVDIDEKLHNYYYSTNYAMTLQNSGNGTAGNYNYYWATQIFSKEELPEGTVIVILNGYQYRPEGWQTMNSKNTSTRPGNVLGKTDTVKVVDSAWWSNYNYRGFNLAKQGNNTNISADDYTAFAIYVPKAN